MLTNERIDRMVGRTNWLLLTFANGTQSIALDPVAARNFARAIEAEVLQSQELVGGITPFNPLNAASNVLPCRAQNATHAPQDVLQNADATQAQAQEPVAWFAFADNNGPVPLELWGFDEKACKHAVLENARSVGWKGTIDGYLLHMSWIIRPLFLSPTIPEGVALVHAAPNKAAFIGGFSFNIEETCSACSLHGAQEDCEVCGGDVTYSRQVTVPWATIKEIHRAMLATAQGEK